MHVKSFALAVAQAVMSCAAAAQTLDQDRADCMSSNVATKIRGCSADILSTQETRPNLAVAYNNRAAAYDAKGLHDLAIADATRALEIDPNYASALNERAWAYHGKAEDAKALPDAERAVALSPADPYSLETRAEIYEALGERLRAIADYREALKLAPDLQPAKVGLDRIEPRSGVAKH
jgi:tetratricopeptide (TPR) repeat protein